MLVPEVECLFPFRYLISTSPLYKYHMPKMVIIIVTNTHTNIPIAPRTIPAVSNPLPLEPAKPFFILPRSTVPSMTGIMDNPRIPVSPLLPVQQWKARWHYSPFHNALLSPFWIILKCFNLMDIL